MYFVQLFLLFLIITKEKILVLLQRVTFEHLTTLCVLLWWQIFVSYDSKWGPRKLHQTHLLLNNINVKCSKETMV